VHILDPDPQHISGLPAEVRNDPKYHQFFRSRCSWAHCRPSSARFPGLGSTNTSPHAWALISWSATWDTYSAICNATVGLRDVTDHSAISSDNLLQVLDQRITRAFISVRAFVFFVSVIVVKGSPHRDRRGEINQHRDDDHDAHH
jgi:hypothetical protein